MSNAVKNSSISSEWRPDHLRRAGDRLWQFHHRARYSPAMYRPSSTFRHWSSMRYECWHSYRRKNIRTSISAFIFVGRARAGARTHSKIGRPPLSELRIIRQAWSSQLDADGTTPSRSNFFEEVLALRLGGSPRILVVPDSLSVGSNHYERRHLLGIRRGVEAG